MGIITSKLSRINRAYQGKGKKDKKRRLVITMAMLAAYKGIKIQTVYNHHNRGKFNMASLESVLSYLGYVRTASASDAPD
jgi:hypothetical protein